MRVCLLNAGIVAILCVGVLERSMAQPPNREASMSSGAELYHSACAACHEGSGRGRTRLEVGFDTPLPDFADCNFATREPDEDWLAISHAGGPVRGFDAMMPAFGEALSQQELQRILGHIRTFCTDAAWPRGELNLPRALFTEKAYPEDEAVITVGVASEGPTAVTSELLWERRLGARSQIELSVPFALRETAPDRTTTEAGLGDIGIGVKHALLHSLASGSIFSVGAEIILPTGEEARGLGAGTAVFEPFVLYGKILPAAAFLQAQVLVELPQERGFEDELAWRAALGKTFTTGAFGRTWTPMIEVFGARELTGDANTDWDVAPQLQVTLNQRQHVVASLGVRYPLTEPGTRDTEVIFYVLWDWFDGGLLDGW